MMEYIEFDGSPIEEDCVQVSQTEDYLPKMRAECRRYVEMLEKRFPDVPGFFTIKSNSHDFGTYLEVRYNFDDNEEGWDSSNFVELNLPMTWKDNEVLPFVFPQPPKKGILERFAESEGIILD